MEYPIEYFWQPADGDDYIPAFMRAQASVPNYEPLTIKLSNRRYTCNSQLDVICRLAIIGEEANGLNLSNAVDSGGTRQVPTLYFPNSAGIYVHYSNGVNSTYATDITRRVERFTLKNVSLRGSGRASGITRHGIDAHSVCFVEGCSIREFGGYGLKLVANTGWTTADVFGNINFAEFRQMYVLGNGHYGVYMDGGDANQVMLNGCFFNDNGSQLPTFTATTTAVTAASRILTCTVASHPFRTGDLVSGSGLLDSLGAAANFDFGWVTSASTPTSLVINTTRSTTNIPDGVFTDGAGTITGRAAQMVAQPLIGSVFLNCETGANLHSGDTIVSLQGYNTYQHCYIEGVGPSVAGRIYPPAVAIGGSLTPATNAVMISGSTNGLRAHPLIECSNNWSGTTYFRAGSTTNNGFCEFVDATSNIVLVREGSRTGWIELLDANNANLIPFAFSHGGNVRAGRGKFWIPQGFEYGGVSETVLGTSYRNFLGTGTIDTVQVNYQSIRVREVASVTTGATGAVVLSGGHDLPNNSTDPNLDVRLLVRNTAGSTSSNGLFRGRFSTSTTLLLHDSAGAAVAVGGSYTANTGWAAVLRAIGYSNAIPTGGLWCAGDVIWNTLGDSAIDGGPVGWICTATGTPGTWRAIGHGSLVESASTPIAVGVSQDLVLVTGTGAGAVSVTLPAGATHVVGRITVKDKSGNAAVNNITITPNGAETIDGAASLVISANYGTARLAFNGTDWSVI